MKCRRVFLKIKAQFLINSLESDGLIHGITLFSRKLAHFMYLTNIEIYRKIST